MHHTSTKVFRYIQCVPLSIYNVMVLTLPFYVCIVAGVPLPDFKEFDDFGVDGRNLIHFMFAQIPSDFSFHPTDHIRFLLYLSCNAFCATREIDNRMRHVRLHLISSNSSKSHKSIRLCAPIARFSNQSIKPSQG